MQIDEKDLVGIVDNIWLHIKDYVPAENQRIVAASLVAVTSAMDISVPDNTRLGSFIK